MYSLLGRRVLLRPLRPDDFRAWQDVRRRNEAWLTKWEPLRPPGSPDPVSDSRTFSLRCHARDRERELGTGYGFGIFIGGIFCGELNLNTVQRGPLQSCYVGYWIDEEQSGQGYVPEGVIMLMRYAFEELSLHRLQISIVPRNRASMRVVEKLALRNEGVAVRYLEINGAWEDHARFAITAEEWAERGQDLCDHWL